MSTTVGHWSSDEPEPETRKHPGREAPPQQPGTLPLLASPAPIVTASSSSPRPEPEPEPGTPRVESMPPDRTKVTVGSVLDDKYELRGEIGAGGMGVVYAALDRGLDREVAVKIIHPRLTDQPEFRTRLAEEARNMAKLRHPNVMEIYDLGHVGPSPYVVMPYYRGYNLKAWTDHVQPLPISPAVAIGIIGQACAGIEALHETGLVHYDIKPLNILLSRSTEVVIADLGLTHPAAMREPTGVVSGTLGFIAPEYLTQEVVPSELAAKADVYAIAVTTYWLLTGHMPLPCGSYTDTLYATQYAPLVPPSQRRPELSTVFDEPLLRGLDPNPYYRPSIGEFRQQLFEARDRYARAQDDRARFVVVVDDDPHALELIEQVVRTVSSTTEVITMTDVPAALSIIESRPPDLIITDLELPEINGVELVATVRGTPSTHDVPILMVTGVGGARDWNQARVMGVERFLVKPIDPDTLHDVVARLLQLPAR
ncbi:MAG: serine/threonine-protein kinase [Myxococcota bacterium]